MNIVTPIPTSFAIPTANLSVEAARRDNLARETIPQPSDAKQGAAEQGLGSESDKLRSSVKGNQPLTYERPQVSQNSSAQASSDGQQAFDFDNGKDESAGKDNAEERQQQQAEQRKIDSLEQRDQEVRKHEQAHAAAGGQYAGAPQYQYQRGPDGQRYAVDGEVSIDISAENTPQQTLNKMQQVRAAALAPAEPSPQDLQVAAEAARIAFEARNELAKENSEAGTVASDNADRQPGDIEPPSIDEIVADNQPQIPKRTLEELSASDSGNNGAGPRRSLNIADEQMAQRSNIIASFYSGVSTPAEGGFRASA
ncbi:putative metalloprotease CJM1_0395 family protein [Alteromonas gilva]|uniref:Metalloprotease CJM1_0395 family protein n=1 Tax=Alteromonas gilva TaxID=2987522 RepID=A0ABT5KYQ3_9ALTE|nr:putative metalloprotease CJM1_0395 family protein [Alteromonas gilva]MDC8829314.1 putative metalloprotease CJM1_0395 family protein [Alteromonas gilva]